MGCDNFSCKPLACKRLCDGRNSWNEFLLKTVELTKKHIALRVRNGFSHACDEFSDRKQN
jgi:hypothetical protein